MDLLSFPCPFPSVRGSVECSRSALPNTRLVLDGLGRNSLIRECTLRVKRYLKKYEFCM